MPAIAETRNQALEANPMHPYKRHLLKSQNYIYSGSGSSLPDNSSTDRHDYETSPVLSDERTSAYGSMVSFNNPSKPTDTRKKWFQELEQPPNKLRGGQGQSSESSPQSSSDNFQRIASHPSNPSNQNQSVVNAKRKSRSVDLSHMYLLNGSHDTQLTSTNESVADMSHQLISRYLGQNSNSSLVPRLKSIEMYRENVKKSKDPNILFQFAQYMLQTALTMDATDAEVKSNLREDEEPISQADLRKRFLKEAQHYLRKLSVKGYADAQYLLGDVYASGALGKVENKESFTLFQAAAKHGHIESAYRTAYCFEEGLGTTRDSRKALDFLKFAASRNHPSAMYKLGLYSFYGRMGLPTDVNTKQNGIKWLSRAAARANDLTCAAPFELARIYEQGFLDIIIPDQKYATELYIQAASLGHSPSSTLLGQLYETGNETIPQDTSLSVHYYTQAALKGDPVAMLGLCAWYLLGAEPAFEKDENEAFQWALRAATSGYPKAQFTLGYFYEKGKGCEANMDNAWKWYDKAAKNKDPRALHKMKQREPNNKYLDVNSGKKKHKKSKSATTLNLFKSFDSNDSSSRAHDQLKPTGMFTDPVKGQNEPSQINGKETSNKKAGYRTDPRTDSNDSNVVSTKASSGIDETSHNKLGSKKSKAFKSKNRKKSDKERDCIIM